jgi:hypothetical protein
MPVQAPGGEMTEHQKRLDKTRTELGALPALLGELAACIDERRPVEGGGHAKVTGSPAPLRLDVLHLVDQRKKPGWEGEDPRVRDLGERYGVLPTLESWTRIMAEDSGYDIELTDSPTITSEARVILDNWVWVTDQEWAGELADDVLGITGQIRHALGQIKLRLLCPTCRNPAHTEGHWLVCTEGHQTSVRNLTQQQRRRPAMTTKEIAAEFDITENTLWQWNKNGRLAPINPGKKPSLWMPWDVFRILNPDLVEAAESLDDIPA